MYHIESIRSINIKKVYFDMAKFFKYVFGIIIAVIILLIIAAFVMTKVIDPNDYKGRIQNYIHDKTGRDLKITGKIDWSFFPWLGIHIPDVKLGNPSNVLGPELTNIKSLDIKLRTFPLFWGKVQIHELKLNGAEINLITNKSGQTNWSSWVKPDSKKAAITSPEKNQAKESETPKEADEKETSRIKALTIYNLSITNSTIRIINQETNTTWTFDQVNLHVQNFNSKKNLPITLSFNFKQSDSQNIIQTRFESTANLNLDTNEVYFPKIKINNLLLRPNLPKLPITLNGKLKFNPDQQTLNISDAAIQIANMDIANNISVQNLFGNPSYQVSFSTKNTQLKPLITNLYGKDFATGLLNFNTQVTARGSNSNQIMRSLTGDGKLTVTNGAIQGIDIGRLLNQAIAYINKQPMPKQSKGPRQTRFKSITASYHIANGSLSNHDFKMISEDFTTTGKGVIDLVNKQWRGYELTTSYSHKESNNNFSLPIIITGPLEEPRVVPDFDTLAKGFIKIKIQQYLDKNAKDIGSKLKGLFN